MSGMNRRNVVRWLPDDYVVTREQVGHERYRVTVHDGIRLVSARDFVDPVEAQRVWLDAQIAYVESMAQILPPPLPDRPSRIVEIDEGDVPEMG